MSYIKRLKIKGFKSFAEDTTLLFEPNFNTIIGANGSGKSNIFDALCFVLGRISSKGLRADKLGNLVFNGGKGGKGAKEASVDIFLDNTKRDFLDADIDEVKISRVVKSSGGSKYYFNNRLSTRTDIVTILKRVNINPDGYNIVLQGDIQRIVSMSNNERRELIEEIADINLYEEKKTKSMKKLNEISTKLTEADLLLGEKTKYIRELKSEKELAEKFYDTKNNLLYNSVLLLKSKIIKNHLLRNKKSEELVKLDDRLSETQTKLNTFDEESSKIEESIEKLEKRIELESHKDFVEISKQINNYENEIVTSNEKVNELKKNVEELKNKKEEIAINIDKSKQEVVSLEQKNKTLTKDLKIKESELGKLNKEINKLKSFFSNDSVEELNKIDKDLDELDEEIFDCNRTREDYNLQIERMNMKITHFEEEISKLGNTEAGNKELFVELEQNTKKLKKLIVDISNVANKDSETASRLGAMLKEQEDVLDKYTKIKSRAEHAQNVISGNRAVEEILKFKHKDKSIYGTVSELGSVDSKYSTALETSGGGSLFNIVVDNEDVAIKYINYLKEKQIGKSTFLPLNKIRAKASLDMSVIGKNGVVDYAVNLVRYDKKFENVFNLVFQDTLVIENINFAKTLGIGKYRMVTLDGDFVNKSGALSGGFRSKKRSAGIFKDDKAIDELDKISMKLDTLRESITFLRSEKKDIEDNLYKLRQDKIEIEGEVIKLEKTLEIEGKDVDGMKKEITFLSKDKKIIVNSFKDIEKDIEKLKAKKIQLLDKKNVIKSSISMKDTVDKVSEIESNRDKVREEFIALKSSIENNDLQLNSVYRPEIESLIKGNKNTVELVQKNQNSIKELSENVKAKEKELKVLKVKEKELSKDYKELIDDRDKKKQVKRKIDEKYNKLYETFVKIKEDTARFTLQKEEYGNINKILEEELEIIYEEVKSENDNDEEKLNNFLDKINENLKNEIDIKNLQNKVNALKSKLNSFGSINLKAVQVYDQLSEEYNELLKKRESLNNDKNEIMNLIDELETKKKDIFLENFYKIREHFINIFKHLTSKGEVDLIIEDEKDIFNNGILIKVKLSDKNFLDIKSLSGGEKTITAAAFIFAVQEFNPASFYIFDEVDAALDSWNAEKLGELIKGYSKKAQYIVVSHKEDFIKSSDVIYGVTMDNRKTSDIVSLKFDEIDDDMVNSEGGEE